MWGKDILSKPLLGSIAFCLRKASYGSLTSTQRVPYPSFFGYQPIIATFSEYFFYPGYYLRTGEWNDGRDKLEKHHTYIDLFVVKFKRPTRKI